MQTRSAKLLFMTCITGVFLAAGQAHAKDVAAEKQTAQIPCSNCHQDTKAKKHVAQVGCSNCHLDFIASALPKTEPARAQRTKIGKPK